MLERIIDSISESFIGKRDTIEKVVAVLLAGGHLLIEDVPGVGKTTLAKSLAGCLSCGFTRIQFTPDTLPSDVMGMSIYNMGTGKFEIVQGAIMNNIVMADEINRTSPKTQASLLEAMQEGQVTIDGKMFKLPKLFMVIATQNPIEHAGTYVLPEAQLDRFMMRLSLGYPDKEEEIEMLRRVLGNIEESVREPVASEQDVIYMRHEVNNVKISRAIAGYVTDITRKTRSAGEIILGASPRATVALIKASQAIAYIAGRDYIIPDDVKRIAADVLTHRMIYAPSAFRDRQSEYEFVEEIVSEIKVPDGLKVRKQ
ncbi:MAG: AAA family ATPase [Lachnospiraceae bacterium]|jgi:ATPase associated with various cellular activities AAA_3